MLCTGFVNVENDVMFRFSNLAMNSKIISTLETLSCMWILKIDGDEKGMNCGTQRNVTYHEGPPYSRPSQSGYWKHYIKWKQQPWRQLKVAIVGREARAHVLLALHMLGTGLFQELLNFNRSDLLSRLPKPLVWAAKQTWFLLWSVKKKHQLCHTTILLYSRGKRQVLSLKNDSVLYLMNFVIAFHGCQFLHEWKWLLVCFLGGSVYIYPHEVLTGEGPFFPTICHFSGSMTTAAFG